MARKFGCCSLLPRRRRQTHPVSYSNPFTGSVIQHTPPLAVLPPAATSDPQSSCPCAPLPSPGSATRPGPPRPSPDHRDVSQVSSHKTAARLCSPQDVYFVTREIWEEAYNEVKNEEKLEPLVRNYEEFFDSVLWPDGPGPDDVNDDTERAKTGEANFRKVACEYLEICGRYTTSQGIVSSALEFIKKTKEIIGSALEVSPPASLAWAGVCAVILPVLVNHAEQIAAKEAGFGYVMSRFTWYSQVIDLLNRNHWKSQADFTTLKEIIRVKIIHLYKLLIEYQLRAYYTYCRPLVTLSRDVLKLDDWNNMIISIKDCEKRLQAYMDLNFEQHLLDKLHIVSEDAIRKQRIETSLKFKFPDELPYEVYQAYIDSIDCPLEGTQEGVLAHPDFVSWASGPVGAFVLTGIPGMGKSVLAKSLLIKLPKWRETSVCSFFFKDNGRGQNAANIALCRVLDELFRDHIALVDRIGTKVDRLLPQEVRCSFDLLWSILEETTADSEPGTFTVILDGLDECESESAHKLYNKLGQYLSGPDPKIKFFITTRPLSSHQPFDFPNTFLLRTSEDNYCLDCVGNDIECVVTAKFEHFAQTCIHDDILKHELRALVKPKAERTYLYVKLLFDCLEMKIRDGVPRVPRGWVDSFKSLPATVTDAYLKFLGRVQESHRDDVRRMLHMVVAAVRPLAVREINIALNIRDCSRGSVYGMGLQNEDCFRDWILDACKGFLDVYNGRVYFIHQTAKEFLLADQGDHEIVKPAWLGDFTMQSCHKTLAESSVMYLTLPFRTLARLNDGSNSNDHEQEKVKAYHLKNASYHLWNFDDLDFANYADIHWPLHFHEWQGRDCSLKPAPMTELQSEEMEVLRSWSQTLTTKVLLDVPEGILDAETLSHSLAPEDSRSPRLVIVDEAGNPFPRLPQIPSDDVHRQEKVFSALRSVVMSRTIRALTKYRPYSPIPMDWFSIRILNKDRSYRTLEDAAVARCQLYHGEMFSYVLCNYSETLPVYVHLLSLNASWTIGTLLWNVRLPPGSQRTGDLNMAIPRKVNDDDPDVVDDTLVVIGCFGEQCIERLVTPMEWLKNIYMPPVLLAREKKIGDVPVWLPFIPPPNWQIRHFTIRTIPKELPEDSNNSSDVAEDSD
ncbi:hypothetical protein QBC35DRAFT_457281 [Podospora australis]|uniref:NACHT domain-containing protein n=1 Tax=Podospora australis TaxID=1536484 RepID=A0AAN7ADE5_9PEZI|nr:hypothetical protein QBC35DRAFT_457281 [Podospora australis]